MKLCDSVERVLKQKGSQVYSVPPHITVYEALEEMADKNVGGLLVMKGTDVLGFVSERDYVRKVIIKGHSSRNLQVHEIMSGPVAVNPRTTVDECMQRMTNERCRHLVVVDGERVAGIVSIGDLVNWIMTAQDFTINQLEGYIAGRYPV